MTRDGADVFLFDSGFKSDELKLKCGWRRLPFKDLSVPECLNLIRGRNWLKNSLFDANTFNWKPAFGDVEGIRVGVDYAPDFSLEHGHTAFLEQDNAVEPDFSKSRLEYVCPEWGSRLPVTPGQNYSFVAGVGLARAIGFAFIEFHDEQGMTVSKQRLRVNVGHVGGTELSGYAPIRLDARAPATAKTATVGIGIDSYANDQSGITTSYFFWVRPAFGAQERANGMEWSKPPSNIDALIRACSVAKDEVPDIKRCSIDPFSLDEGDNDLEVIESIEGSSIEKLPINIPVSSSRMRIEADGPYISLDYQHPGPINLLVYVDGEIDKVLTHNFADDGGRSLSPSEKYYDNVPHHLAVVDADNLMVLGETFIHIASHTSPWEAFQQYVHGSGEIENDPLSSQRFHSTIEWLRQLSVKDGNHSPQHLSWLQKMIPSLEKVLRIGFGNNRNFPVLRFPEVEKPDISIVVPVHNKFAVTYHCLAGLLLSFNDASYEVIVVDDGSKDRTKDLEKYVEGIKIHRNSSATGFVRACNAGAELAEGDYVFFLNNDTELTYRALDELVDTFKSFDNVGAVGSKLLFANGRLQEAGGIVWSSGNPWNYGRGESAKDPRFNYARDADYLTGAALMITKELFDQLEGFSSEFAPGYFEDTDLCFKVRAAGYRTVYQPLSQVIHFEGQTSGTSTSGSGMKRYQEINRPKFKRKWSHVFRTHGEEGHEPQAEKDRYIVGRILMIDAETPRPDNDAGSYAAIQEMKLLQSFGYKVTFLPTNLAYMDRYTESLQRMGIETLFHPFCLSTREFLQERGHEFDAVYITRYYVAQQNLEMVKEYAPQAKLLMCNADLHFLRQMRAAVIKTGDAAKAEIEAAMRVRDDEIAMMSAMDVTLSYNDVEHSVIFSHAPEAAKVVKAPWVAEVQPTPASFKEREGICFLGGYGHPPNREAAMYFVDMVMPELTKRIPDAKFYVYGSRMPEDMKSLKINNVEFVGFCEDLFEMYNQHRLFVAPLMTGAGIKGKLISALGHGLPTVASPIAAEGTKLRHGLDCMIAETVDEWIDCVAEAYTNQGKWESLSKASLDYVKMEHSFEKGRNTMQRALEAANLIV